MQGDRLDQGVHAFEEIVDADGDLAHPHLRLLGHLLLQHPDVKPGADDDVEEKNQARRGDDEEAELTTHRPSEGAIGSHRNASE